jgi:hypothetical protein
VSNLWCFLPLPFATELRLMSITTSRHNHPSSAFFFTFVGPAECVIVAGP